MVDGPWGVPKDFIGGGGGVSKNRFNPLHDEYQIMDLGIV